MAAATRRSSSDQRGGDRADGLPQRLALALAGRGEGGVELGLRLTRVRRDGGDDPRRHVRHVVELQAVEVDAGLLLEAAHHRVAQPPLVGEVPIHGPLVDAGALGHRPHRDPTPLADGRVLEQVATRHDDPLARLRRPLAPPRAVVRPARRRRRRGHYGMTTGRVSQPRTVEVGVSLARSVSTSHSGKRCKHLVERHPAFEARQRGAEAEVGAVAEGEVAARVAVDVEPVAIRELAVVAVGRPGQEEHRAALGDRVAVELDVPRGAAPDVRRGRLEAQELLDGVRDEGRGPPPAGAAGPGWSASTLPVHPMSLVVVSFPAPATTDR